MVRFDSTELLRIKEAADREGVSASEYVKTAVEVAVARDTKRDGLAERFASELTAQITGDDAPTIIAQRAYAIADAMLAEGGRRD